jgi:hypothetical protein
MPGKPSGSHSSAEVVANTWTNPTDATACVRITLSSGLREGRLDGPPSTATVVSPFDGPKEDVNQLRPASNQVLRRPRIDLARLDGYELVWTLKPLKPSLLLEPSIDSWLATAEQAHSRYPEESCLSGHRPSRPDNEIRCVHQ